MNPLMEKYFFGELTDSEETTLENLLVNSEESAWEFGQEAEALYKRYGLPEPELPGGQGEGGAAPKGKGGSWLWFVGLLMLMFLSFYGWMIRRSSETLVNPGEKPVPTPVRADKKVIHLVPRTKNKPVPPIATPTSPWATPPSGSPDKVSGNNLKVVVRRETAGPVVVRVLDPHGVEIRRLFSGTLQAGRWGFEWDGRGADGQMVGPGDYKIEVDTDGLRQSRDVNIH